MQALGSVDTVVLDRSGALTFGEPYVERVTPYPGETYERLLELAATGERPSSHPLAKAILKAAARLDLPSWEPESFEYLPGQGVRATWRGGEVLVGNTRILRSIDSLDAQLRMVPVEPGSLLVAYRGYLAGSIRIAEMARAEAVDAVSIFRSMSLGVHLLSGDSRAVVVSLARQLTIEDFDADMAPSEKLAKVQDLVREGKRIVMVGDGINDAPALAEATVGIAVGSATDLGGQNASIRVRENGLLVCADLLQVARRCRNVIRFNLTGTLVIAAISVGLAGAGVLSPLLAAVLRVTLEAAFILNSQRLLPRMSQRVR
jgi:P-type Cu+ transporter